VVVVVRSIKMAFLRIITIQKSSSNNNNNKLPGNIFFVGIK
jgi:hypothetical protein